MNPMRVAAAAAIVACCVGEMVASGCDDNFSEESCRYMSCSWKTGRCLEATQPPIVVLMTPAPKTFFQEAWDLELKPAVVFFLGSLSTLIIGLLMYVCQLWVKCGAAFCKECSKVAEEKAKGLLVAAPTVPLQTQPAIVSSPSSVGIVEEA